MQSTPFLHENKSRPYPGKSREYGLLNCDLRARGRNQEPTKVYEKARPAAVDRRTTMELLRKAAPVMGIKKTALDVLEKLLSFHPDGIIDPMSGNTIVFPSNETLRERLNGLSERTLRRAIGDLVEADLVCRCDSPNRKRYRRVLAGKVIAYGFDVAPLARRIAEFERLAEVAASKRERLELLKIDVQTLSGRLKALGGVAEGERAALLEEARRLLRRTPSKRISRP